jgi:predicted transcriptional regulator
VSSVGFSSALGSLSNAAQATSTAKTASANETSTTETSQTNSGLKEDTVKLSLAAQVKLMHRQGQSASVIASSLGTSVTAVDGYLNIKVATQASATTTTPETSTESASTSTPTATTETNSSGTSTSSKTTAAASTAQAATVTEVAKS